jgi:Flp pilus assembly protein TadG
MHGPDPVIRRLVHRSRESRGSTLVEFALVVPIVVLLFMGIAEFGRFYFTRITLQHAVREAARFAVTGSTLPDPDTGDPMSRVESIRAVILEEASNLDLVVEELEVDPPDGGGPSAVVTVTARFHFEFIAPVIRQMFPGGGYDFTVATAMKNEPFF